MYAAAWFLILAILTEKSPVDRSGLFSSVQSLIP